jgi:hypothetical protein
MKIVESVDRIKQLYAAKCDEAAKYECWWESETSTSYEKEERKIKAKAAAAKRRFNKIVDALVPGDLTAYYPIVIDAEGSHKLEGYDK